MIYRMTWIKTRSSRPIYQKLLSLTRALPSCSGLHFTHIVKDMRQNIARFLVLASPLTVTALAYGKVAPEAFRDPKSDAVDHVNPSVPSVP